MKQYLSKKQVQQLLDFGVNFDTPWCRSMIMTMTEGVWVPNRPNEYPPNFVATLTVGELIEILPTVFYSTPDDYEHPCIYIRLIVKNIVRYTHPNVNSGFISIADFCRHDELIDNLFDAFVWFLEHHPSQLKN